MDGDFVKLWFSGKRVPRGQLPVGVLRELRAYQDAIREIAGILWREETGKKKLPQNFKRSFSLAIVGTVEPGSAGVHLACTDAQQQMFATHFDKAQDILCRLATEANGQKEFAANDAVYLEAAGKVGAKLQEGEVMGIDPHGRGKVIARVTPATVAELGRALSSFLRPQAYDVVGRVVAVDTVNCTFSIDSVDGRRIKGRYDPAAIRLTDTISVAVPRDAGYARVQGTIQMMVGAESGEREMTALSAQLLGQPQPDFEARMAKLIRDPEAQRTLAESARLEIRRLVWECGVPNPFVYLSGDGGLRMEWTFPGPWDVSVGFEQDVIFGDATNPKTGETDDFELPWSVDRDALAERVRELLLLAGWSGEA